MYSTRTNDQRLEWWPYGATYLSPWEFERAQVDAMYEPAGQHSERGSGHQSPWTFPTYLEAYPEVRDALQQRIEERPEYRAWLLNMGGTVLAVLDPAGADGTRARP